MPGIKRGARSTSLSPQPPSSKAMKTSTTENNQTEITLTDTSTVVSPKPDSDFSKNALPLHVNLTHTPPKLPEEGETVVPDDPGHIGTFTLIPHTLPAGKGSWRGNGKVKVELLDGEDRTQVDAVVSIKVVVVDNKETPKHDYEAVSEVDGGIGGYESDNDDVSL